jgi:hypothetical protein
LPAYLANYLIDDVSIVGGKVTSQQLLFTIYHLPLSISHLVSEKSQWKMGYENWQMVNPLVSPFAAD